VTSYPVGKLEPGSTTYFTVGAVASKTNYAFSPWVPGTTARAALAGTVLTVYGSEQRDIINIGQNNGLIEIEGIPILVKGNFEQVVSAREVAVIRVFGKGGDDVIRLDDGGRLDGGNEPITARAVIYGGDGDDYIIGSPAGPNIIYGDTGKNGVHGLASALNSNDTIYGGNKNDILYGEGGNDKLYGKEGNDQLFGGYGGDWLETEPQSPLWGQRQSSELFNLGPKEIGVNDWCANNWVVGGTRMVDVEQVGSGTCSFLASLASVARSGAFSLANRIRYLGNRDYGVTLFDGTEWTEQTVHFDGTYDTDVDPESAQRGEYWTILFQRAYLQMLGWPLNTAALIGLVGESKALNALTGEDSTSMAFPNSVNSFNSIEAALRASPRRNVVVATFPDELLDSPRLVGNHVYTVVDVGRDLLGRPGWIKIRNPWGIDDLNGGTDGVNDGFITMPWSALINDVKWVTFN
jgi:Ca2+-binding RTX toxin-like protein